MYNNILRLYYFYNFVFFNRNIYMYNDYLIIIWEVKNIKNYNLSSKLIILLISILIIPSIATGELYVNHELDYDPFIDIVITIEIYTIRGYVKTDNTSNFDFSILIEINNEQFFSPIWKNSRYLYDINWSISKNIPDNIAEVSIKILLFDNNTPCDLNGIKNDSSIELVYDIRTNHWSGDDYIGDPSGYGRLNGCDDESFYEEEKDCEIWFNIYQNDIDNDKIPTWAEINIYGSDPFIDNSNDDFDNDDVPFYWEHHWNYNPNVWDDHQNLDPDNDGLTNFEEFLTSGWFSDPFRKDLFIELDQMELGPNGEGFKVPNSTKELLADRYNPRNILYHLDDGCMGGGEIIPFDYVSWRGEILGIYQNYFLHNDPNNWRRRVFRYAVFIYENPRATAYAFVGEGRYINSNVRGINSFQVTTTAVDNVVKKRNKPRDFVCASYIMHETGHTLGIDIFNPFGCDNRRTVNPWRLCFWIFSNYKSVMNYRYVHQILDYSDGSNGLFDHDDWGTLNFNWFQLPEN